MMTMEDLEWRRLTEEQAVGLLKRKEAKPCKTENEHHFDSTGECKKCGAHRSPYRAG